MVALIIPFATLITFSILAFVAKKSAYKKLFTIIYIVSSMGVTGVRGEITTDIEEIVEGIRKVTDTPLAVGFGINTPEQAAKYSQMADGVIVGSAIVEIIARHGADAGKYIYDYVKSMVEKIDKA